MTSSVHQRISNLKTYVAFHLAASSFVFAFGVSALGLASTQMSPRSARAAAVGMKTSAAVVESLIRDGQTSIRLSRGDMHLYGMAISGPGSSGLFAAGQFASVFHEGGLLGAAIAYGENTENHFSTHTKNHVVGGVSVGGSWDSFQAFYGSNSAQGATNAAANFTVSENSLVVFIGLAAGEQFVKLEGIPGVQIDASNSGDSSDGAMIAAHAYLPPGQYTVIEHSSAREPGKDSEYMADLIGIFVFGSKP